jgi:hypothetical protein
MRFLVYSSGLLLLAERGAHIAEVGEKLSLVGQGLPAPRGAKAWAATGLAGIG